MAPLTGGNLSKVDVYVSSIVNASIDDTWRHARDFGQAAWWAKAGQGEFNVKRLGTHAIAEIGCERMFTIGTARLFEELSALDDLEHIVRWSLISNPHTLSPFGQASFLNYTSSLQLRPVTMSQQTFAEWRGSFYTEPHYAAQMERVLQSWYHVGIKGLEITAQATGQAVIPPHPAPLQPNAMNPNYSLPIQPPSSDQLAFNDPMEARTMGPPLGNPGANIGLDERQATTQERYTNGIAAGPGMATTSSQAWQAAHAAFGQPQAPQPATRNPRGGSSSASPNSLARPVGQMSNGRERYSQPSSSIDSINNAPLPRRTTDVEAGLSGGYPGTYQGIPAHHSGPAYAPDLGPIDERLQLPYAARDYYPEGALSTGEPLNQSMNAVTIQSSSNCSSLSSNHSQASSHRGNISRNRISSLDEPISEKPRRAAPIGPSRRSWQGQESPTPAAGGSASAMKNEAMQAFNMNSRQEKRGKRRPIQPDWDSMKETAFVETQHDAEIMNKLASNLGNHHRDNTQRSSLEEEVAKLQERHNKLHGRRTSNTERPFVSPFSAGTSPFGEQKPPASGPFGVAQQQAPAGPFGAAQQSAAPNPFAAAQPTS